MNIQINGTASQLENSTLTIHDVIGKEVLSLNANSIGRSLTLETNNFNTGSDLQFRINGNVTDTQLKIMEELIKDQQ